MHMQRRAQHGKSVLRMDGGGVQGDKELIERGTAVQNIKYIQYVIYLSIKEFPVGHVENVGL